MSLRRHGRRHKTRGPHREPSVDCVGHSDAACYEGAVSLALWIVRAHGLPILTGADFSFSFKPRVTLSGTSGKGTDFQSSFLAGASATNTNFDAPNFGRVLVSDRTEIDRPLFRAQKLSGDEIGAAIERNFAFCVRTR
jgi:hypothetical protein